MNKSHLFALTMMNIVPLDYAMPFLLIWDVILLVVNIIIHSLSP